MVVTLTDSSHAKYAVVDMTFPVQYVGAAIIIPYPQPGIKTYLLSVPFRGKASDLANNKKANFWVKF